MIITLNKGVVMYAFKDEYPNIYKKLLKNKQKDFIIILRSKIERQKICLD